MFSLNEIIICGKARKLYIDLIKKDHINIHEVMTLKPVIAALRNS